MKVGPGCGERGRGTSLAGPDRFGCPIERCNWPSFLNRSPSGRGNIQTINTGEKRLPDEDVLCTQVRPLKSIHVLANAARHHDRAVRSASLYAAYDRGGSALTLVTAQLTMPKPRQWSPECSFGWARNAFMASRGELQPRC